MLSKDIEQNFPFLSIVTYGGQEYIGIIANQDQYVTSMYVYNYLNSDNEKSLFLELGETWWWESNRMIPINIFMRSEIAPFNYTLITMNSKDVKIKVGPTVNLHNLSMKRVKRKHVQLIRKVK